MSMKWAVTRPNYFLLLIVFLAGVSCDAAPARDKTIYANTSNKELKQKALQLVKSIRDLMHSYNKKDRELMDEYRKKDQRDHWIQESGALLDSALRSYKENYSADAILLRNELSKRLPRLVK
jgi:hypothetical protein